MNALTIANALAAKYASGTLAPPSGYTAVRVSTAALPNNIPTSPWVLVTLPSGQLVLGTGEINHQPTFHVLFHYAKASGDVPRDMTAMLSWLGVLLAATWSDMDLGVSGVRKAYPTTYEFVTLTYGGDEFYGWDIAVTVDFRETVTLAA